MSEPLKGAVIRENGGTDEDAVRTEVALRSQVAADEHALSISGAASAGVGLSRLSETDGQEHHRAAGHLSPAVGAGDRPVRRDAASVVPDAATSLPWRCRCTEPAPDRIGVVRVRRPGDESSCPRCGSTQAEYEAELEKGVDLWGASDFDGPQFCSKEHRDGVPTAGASLLEQGFPHLISVASQSWKGVTSGESEKDHGCTEEGYDGANGVTLCGRKMGMRWFPRGERFDGAHSFHCERCVRAGVKRGLIDPSKLDKKFKGKGIGRAA